MDWIVILFAAVMAGVFAPMITPIIMRWFNKYGFFCKGDENNENEKQAKQ